MKQYDVAVCGGGFAGISAALAAGTAAAMTNDFSILEISKLQEKTKKQRCCHTRKGFAKIEFDKNPAQYARGFFIRYKILRTK